MRGRRRGSTRKASHKHPSLQGATPEVAELSLCTSEDDAILLTSVQAFGEYCMSTRMALTLCLHTHAPEKLASKRSHRHSPRKKDALTPAALQIQCRQFEHTACGIS